MTPAAKSRWRIGLALLGGVYLFTWALTARFGNGPIQSMLCDDLKEKYHTEVNDYGELKNSHELTAYYCHTRATVMPFVVSVNYGYNCGVWCSSGMSGLALWLPTRIIVPFYRFDWWET